jgi:ribosomal protein S18 acetylase RimI-like enzyme
MESNMKNEAYHLRPLTIDDYDQLRTLWLTIKGFRIRTVDDSREGVARFLERNPLTSVAAIADKSLVGSILCGHDGRQGCFYHVCVDVSYRCQGVGTAMVQYCMDALAAQGITKVKLIAFTANDLGNTFWHALGWTKREDLFYYDITLNEDNVHLYVT